MTKENVLFSVIGVLLGFIIGFFFANSVNQRAVVAPGAAVNAADASGNLPPNHPQLPMNAVKDQQGLQTSAEEAAQRARAAPENFEAQLKAADLYAQLDRYEEAIGFLLSANKLRPDNTEVVIQLGNANFELGRYEAAERWYQAALLKEPANVNVRTDLGLTFFLRNPRDTDRAIEEFRRSLQYDPQHELTLQNITVALTSKGLLKDAQAMLARLEQVSPNNRAITKLRADIDKANPAAK